MPEALPLQSINHVARVTRDLEASTAFYRDVLGFRPILRPDFGFPGAWLYNYGLQIHLITRTEENTSPARDISIRADHVAFHVEDTDQVERLLKEHGIPYRSNVAANGVTQLFFHDPDGNHIEIGTYPPAREPPGDEDAV